MKDAKNKRILTDKFTLKLSFLVPLYFLIIFFFFFFFTYDMLLAYIRYGDILRDFKLGISFVIHRLNWIPISCPIDSNW